MRFRHIQLASQSSQNNCATFARPLRPFPDQEKHQVPVVLRKEACGVGGVNNKTSGAAPLDSADRSCLSRRSWRPCIRNARARVSPSECGYYEAVCWTYQCHYVSHLFSEELITAGLQMSTLTRTRADSYANRCYALPIPSKTGLRGADKQVRHDALPNTILSLSEQIAFYICRSTHVRIDSSELGADTSYTPCYLREQLGGGNSVYSIR